MLFWLCNVCNLDMSDLKFNSAFFNFVSSCDVFVSSCSEIVQSANYKSTNVNSRYFNQAIFDMWCIKIFSSFTSVWLSWIRKRYWHGVYDLFGFTKPDHTIFSLDCTFVKTPTCQRTCLYKAFLVIVNSLHNSLHNNWQRMTETWTTLNPLTKDSWLWPI